jgi:hypothetical protein
MSGPRTKPEALRGAIYKYKSKFVSSRQIEQKSIGVSWGGTVCHNRHNVVVLNWL